MSIDQAESAALVCRAGDSERTPGEQAAIEEAERCEGLAARHRSSSPADAERFLRKAQEWRKLAVKARAEDLS